MSVVWVENLNILKEACNTYHTHTWVLLFCLRNEMKRSKLERNETKRNVGGDLKLFGSKEDLYVGRTRKNLKHFYLRDNTPFL